MDLFVIDNVGESDLLSKDEVSNVKATRILNESSEKPAPPFSTTSSCADIEDELSEDDGDYGDLPRFTCDLSNVISTKELVTAIPKSTEDIQINNFIKLLRDAHAASKYDTDTITSSLGRTDINKEMKGAVTNAIERQDTVPNPSEKNKTKLRKLEAAKTKGSNWYNMPATELTDEVKRDLEVIQMRSVLDPKHFYKKNDLKALPKYFQVGKVESSPLDYYNERGERKNKKKTIVDELMADAQFQRFNKRKYTEAVQEKQKSGYHKANKKMKKLKKNK